MAKLGERFKNSWNAFFEKSEIQNRYPIEQSSFYRPDRVRLSFGNYRSIITSVFNQIAVDVSLININHVRLNDEGNFKEIIDDDLNYALTKSANLDQTGRALIRDATMTMLNGGCVAIVPTVTDKDIKNTDSYKIYEMRVGEVVEWKPREVRVNIYNDIIGVKQELLFPKSDIAIIENPFFAIMNEPNSLAQRLTRVLSQLDRTNDKNSSGKLDLIIQFPYSTKNEGKKLLAKQRKEEIESQLDGSQHGIAYIDSTEHVIQLNRPIENDLWNQAKDLMGQLFNQLGLSQSIFDGTADEQTLLNYYNRTIEPILSAITEEMERKWISKTAISQNQGIRYFKSPFKLTTLGTIAELADKMTRNEILTSNEVRSIIGMKPSDDPKANELRNANLNHPDEKDESYDEKEIEVY